MYDQHQTYHWKSRNHYATVSSGSLGIPRIAYPTLPKCDANRRRSIVFRAPCLTGSSSINTTWYSPRIQRNMIFTLSAKLGQVNWLKNEWFSIGLFTSFLSLSLVTCSFNSLSKISLFHEVHYVIVVAFPIVWLVPTTGILLVCRSKNRSIENLLILPIPDMFFRALDQQG